MQISARCVLPVDIDQQIAKQAIDEPQAAPSFARATAPGERDFEFIKLIVPRLVDARRLARRADEQSREEIGQRRMALPIEHQALQQIGPTQERRIGRRRAAKHDMIAAARTGLAAVGHEFVVVKPDLTGVLVKRGRRLDGLTPVAAG